ncbi:NlpC/P60 family protein [Pseudahrensia aquimaris]|uniref:NlpC/P60 family protein n=1 Tax=Pseudahrensia aquimaris TaxID=744461 RepID=A0ABW3FD81_9HYPH
MSNSFDAALVVSTARKWIGTPYLHQGAAKGIGCDCIGLVRGVWAELGGAVPAGSVNYASSWSEIDRNETLLSALGQYLHQADIQDDETGMIVAFRIRAGAAAKHVAILTGQDTFIHAYQGNHVVENALSPFWRRRIAGRFTFHRQKA